MNGKSMLIGMEVWHIVSRHISTNIAGEIKYRVPVNILRKM